jgi:hypothetical protein
MRGKAIGAPRTTLINLKNPASKYWLKPDSSWIAPATMEDAQRLPFFNHFRC